jgi:hypothetical protein
MKLTRNVVNNIDGTSKIQICLVLDVREAKDLRYYLARHEDNKRPRTNELREAFLSEILDALDEAGELVVW